MFFMTELGTRTIPLPAAEPVTLRPASAADEPFLFALFASTREEELAPTGWDRTTRDQFLRSQFAARQKAYADMFPDAQAEIFVQQQHPIGSWILRTSPQELHLIDFALLPAHRDQGVGTALLTRLQINASAHHQSIRLAVLPWERAIHLYQRLGFQKTEQAGTHEIMCWTPVSPSNSP